MIECSDTDLESQNGYMGMGIDEEGKEGFSVKKKQIFGCKRHSDSRLAKHKEKEKTRNTRKNPKESCGQLTTRCDSSFPFLLFFLQEIRRNLTFLG